MDPDAVPGCAKLGLIFNPAHANSRQERDRIADLCTQHGLTLVERNLSTPAEITAVLQSLLQADPDVVFGMGDNTVVSSFADVANACRQAGIPLVADDNSLMGAGALFSIGGSPLLEGRHTGQLAVRVLLGENPAGIPFMPSVETETAVDMGAARDLGMTWPVERLKEADIFHNLHRLHDRPLRIAMVNLVQSHLLERSEAGVRRGLRESGLIEGTDFTIRNYNAQVEIAQLPALLDAARQRDPDLMLTITTPAMIAAAQQISDIPIVFTVASDPAALGIFDEGAHPANMTGVHDDPPLDRLPEMAMRHDPGLMEAWGAQAGRLAAKVLAGVPPSVLPLQVTEVRQVLDSKSNAQAQIPPRTLPLAPRRKPFEIRIVPIQKLKCW